MLGGSGGHNGMVYLRGNDRDFDEWEEMGNKDWGWKKVLPYFKKSEGNQNKELLRIDKGRYHSGKGKMIVDNFNRTDPFGDILLAAGLESGNKHVSEFNGGQWLGYSFSQGTVYQGRRQSPAKSFLIPASKRPNLHVITNAVVSKIEIENGKAVSVLFTYNGTHNLVAKNRKDIILSAGAISSPQILMLSGIGPEKELNKFQIKMHKNLPVGENLQDHATIALFFKFKSMGAVKNSDEEILNSFYQLVVNNTGSLTDIGTEGLSVFINTKKDGPHPDVQIVFLHFNQNTTDFEAFVSLYSLKDAIKSTLLKQIKESDIVLIAVALLKPKSKGKITLNSRSISDPPNIDLNWLDDKDDIETLLRGIKLQVDNEKTKAYQKYSGQLIRLPLPDCDTSTKFKSDDYYRCYMRHLTVSSYHSVGTSKMGPCHDPTAVVDHKLRVIGIEKLRQIDAGIMPTVISGDTNAPTVMIAEKGSDIIKADWSN